MSKYTYNCEYCGKNYIPKRRGKQKFCSASCRTRYWQENNKEEKNLPAEIEQTASSEKKKVTLEGIGEAAIGSAASDLFQKGLAKVFNIESEELRAIKRLEQQMKRLEEIILAIPNLDLSKLTAPGPHWEATSHQQYAQLPNGQTIVMKEYQHPSNGMSSP